MKFKGILLDFDNTLYNYNNAHKFALDEVSLFFEKKFNLSNSDFISLFNSSKNYVKKNLSSTASSHHRTLYFQKMLEDINENPISYSLLISDIYWKNFVENIKLFDGVLNFLNLYKNKICLVTDLIVDVQLKKINQLNLNKYIKNIVTSEEVGVEKPDSRIFKLALSKLKLSSDDVCMIGDNFERDIVGATNLGIRSYWLNRDKNNVNYKNNLINEFYSFNDLIL